MHVKRSKTFIRNYVLKYIYFLNSFSELDEFLLELDEDVEGMQSTIYYLQQQLREAKEQILHLEKEKHKLLGVPNGSPNHKLLAPEVSINSDSQSSHLQSECIKNNKSLESVSSAPLSNDLNGTEKMLIEKEIKVEVQWSPQKNQVVDKAPIEASKKINNETSVILSPKDIKQEMAKPSSTPESNVQSVIVENKNALNHEKQTPLVERTNTLVDGLETNQNAVLRTSEHTSEVTTAISEEVTNNTTSSVKRTSEGGRGRKRTRPRTPVEPEDKKEENLPVRKRTRRREAQDNEEKRTALEIDTETEVQVAQTLAYWASAKQEKTEGQSDPSGSLLGNGEVKKDSEDK